MEIDWGAHGRLVHFRNRGIAHLTPEKLLRSVKLNELSAMIGIIGRLATVLRDLCQSNLAFHTDMRDTYSRLAKKAVKNAPS